MKERLTALWAAIAAQDAGAMRSHFDPEAVVCWHCTNEQFTLEEYIRANCEYPGQWRGRVERVEPIPGGAAVCARVWLADGSASFHCAAFYRIVGEKIVRADEYWGDDGPAPAWRRDKRIGVPIEA